MKKTGRTLPHSFVTSKSPEGLDDQSPPEVALNEVVGRKRYQRIQTHLLKSLTEGNKQSNLLNNKNMARVGKNIVTQGLSGMIGGTIVFRQVGDQTIVGQAPVKQDRTPSEDEKAHRTKFGQAILYGKSAVADPTSKSMYQKQADDGQSAFNVAVADFMNAPDIDEVDVTNYTGEIGSTIRVRATDDFQVSRVYVKIEGEDGSMVEEGEALANTNGLDYLYTAKKKNVSLTGDKITIEVNDIPGNEAVKSQTL